jgi:hypothetical protein
MSSPDAHRLPVMAEVDRGSRATILLVVGDQEMQVGAIDPTCRCDLALVDEVLQLRLAARRLGWSIRLTHVDDDLRELLELVGVADVLTT